MKKKHVYQDTDRDLIYYFEDGVQTNNEKNQYKFWNDNMKIFMSNNPGIKVKLLGRFVVTKDGDTFESIAKDNQVAVNELYILNPFYDEDSVFQVNATVIIPVE